MLDAVEIVGRYAQVVLYYVENRAPQALLIIYEPHRIAHHILREVTLNVL